MGLETRLRLAKLFVGLRADVGADRLKELTEAAVAGGADLIGLQAVDVDDRALAKAHDVVREAAYPDAIVVIMHAAEVARTVGADAVLCGLEVVNPSRPHEWGLRGRTVNNVTDFAKAMRESSTDFVLIGPAFANRFDEQGLEMIREAERIAPADRLTTKPWFAAGGIHEGNISLVLEAGAKRVAVNRGVELAPNPQLATTKLDEALRQAWVSDADLGALTFEALGRQSTPSIGNRHTANRKPGCTCSCHDEDDDQSWA